MSTYPDVKASFYKLKWQASLLIRQTDPDLRIHQQAVVQVSNALLGAVPAAVDSLALFSSSPLQTVQAQQIPILCLNYVFFCFVSPQLAHLNEIGRIAHGSGNS